MGCKTPPTPLIRGEETIEEGPDLNTLTSRYTDAATEFIRKSSRTGKPFFLYMPHHNAARSARGRAAAFAAESLCGLYGDVVQEIDWSVGEVLRAAPRARDRSKHLGDPHQRQWRGRRRIVRPVPGGQELHVGGWRTRPVHCWVAREGPGRGGHSRICHRRWTCFPPLSKLAGLEMPKDRVHDGEDLTPVLLRNDPGREPLFFYYRNNPGNPGVERDEKLQAVRKGRWKLHIAVPEKQHATAVGRSNAALVVRPASGHFRAAEHGARESPRL